MFLNNDMSTLIFSIILVNVFIAIFLILYMKTQKTYRGFGEWVMADGFTAMAYIFFYSSTTIPFAVSSCLGHIFMMSAVLVRCEAVRRFLRYKRMSLVHLYILAVACALVVFFATFIVSTASRLAISSLYLCSYAFAMGWILLKTKSKLKRILPIVLAVLFVFFGISLIFRFYELVFIFSINNLTKGICLTIFLESELIIDVSINMLFLTMNSQRLALNLSASQKELEDQVASDHLTNVYSRRKFIELGEKELKHSKDYYKQLSLIMFDIDCFKNINDTYGHVAGDKVLVGVADTVNKLIRVDDVIGRLGGDEFAVYFPDMGIGETFSFAEKLRSIIERTTVEYLNEELSVTVSIGVARITDADENFEDFLNRADKALYQAKNNGRNKVKMEDIWKDVKY